MSGFWKSWMTVWSWGVFAFGAVLALAAFPATDAPARAAFALLGPAIDPALWDAAPMRFATGLMGAVTLGWGLTVLAVVRAGAGGATLWRSITLAMLAWYLIDSTISITTGFWLNAVSNTLLTATYLVAMIGSGALQGK